MKLFKRKDSENYFKLSTRIQDLELRMKSLELDLMLYTKRLKASKGLIKKEQETEDIKNPVLLPDNG